jgi:hypothetical protein
MNEAERDKALAERRRAYMQSDFDPGHRPGAMPTADLRLASAAEYAAFQLGQINRSLARLVALMEKGGA